MKFYRNTPEFRAYLVEVGFDIPFVTDANFHEATEIGIGWNDEALTQFELVRETPDEEEQ